jgi:hypothetical protein
MSIGLSLLQIVSAMVAFDDVRLCLEEQDNVREDKRFTEQWS